MSHADSSKHELALVVARAPAKVNLRLEVLEKRGDGYHEIRTWMLAVDLCDEVRVRLARHGGVRLRVRGPQFTSDISEDERNLAQRAARLALDLVGRGGNSSAHGGVDVELIKNIPSQAGLGGASSDAAATFIAVQRAVRADVPLEVASSALAELGSDCAFFATARRGVALCTGRGEHVHASDAVPRGWRVAILTPDVLASTARVYRAVTTPLSEHAALPSLPNAWPDVSVHAARQLSHNDLEAAALDAIPGLREWRELLDACGAEHFRMSGSGSSFFGLFDDTVDASQSLGRCLEAARTRGLPVRGSWLVRPAGLGAHIVESC
ncbi:MAG: 4-(cytidine 5'-diphospho)-2-C-methyl-D-erythritol kinase [Planctomycetota bacterium]